MSNENGKLILKLVKSLEEILELKICYENAEYGFSFVEVISDAELWLHGATGPDLKIVARNGTIAIEARGGKNYFLAVVGAYIDTYDRLMTAVEEFKKELKG
jgi:hypothetical protein